MSAADILLSDLDDMLRIRMWVWFLATADFGGSLLAPAVGLLSLSWETSIAFAVSSSRSKPATASRNNWGRTGRKETRVCFSACLFPCVSQINTNHKKMNICHLMPPGNYSAHNGGKRCFSAVAQDVLLVRSIAVLWRWELLGLMQLFHRPGCFTSGVTSLWMRLRVLR